ncbi:MAG: MFS transporter [Candidatus Bathyarchaeota archaeon]|nr:MFS transporter [Candidatus Bathyarchaeota archaeon]
MNSLWAGFNKELKLIGLAMASRRVVMGGMMVIRSLYLYTIGFDPFTIGLLSTIATVVGAARSGIVGLLADKYGKKVLIILGGLFSALRFAIYAFSVDFVMLVIAQGVGAFGEGAGAGQPATTGIIADNSAARNRTRVFSVFAITNAIASAVGSLLAGLPKGLQGWFGVEYIQSYQLFFLLGAIFSILSTVVIIPLKEKSKVRKAAESESILPKKSWKAISRFSFVRATGGFGFGITETLIPLWFKIIFGVGEEVLSIVYAASRFLSIFSYLGVIRFASAVGEMGSIAITRIASSVMMLAMVVSPNYLTAAILLMAYRVSLMFTMPVRQSFITSIVEPSERSSAVGISNLSRMAVRSFGPATGGYIMQSISMSLPFFIGSGVVALNGVFYYVLFHKAEPTDDGNI